MSVAVSYTELVSDDDLSDKMAKAFGTGSRGLIVISGIPKFVELKGEFLPKSHTIAHLPQAELAKLEDEKTLWNAGWSHGKERLGAKPDTAKGSYYFNPLTDAAGTPEQREQYPLSYPLNVWPEKGVVDGFEDAGKALGCLMREVVVLLSKHIDRFVKTHFPDYEELFMYNAMKSTEKAKGRLLYYFPLSEEEAKNAGDDSWIGWHNDSGFLTALAGDMYVDEKTGAKVACPDAAAGLYVNARDGSAIKVDIPEDCMAVQIGECAQIVTGGRIVATPHCVRGAKVPGIGRISFPCFIDTAPMVKLNMPKGCTRDDVFQDTILNEKVPRLKDRWVDGQTFGEFLKVTFERYYS